MTTDLKIVSSTLSQAPFNKKWSIIQLHDELPVEELLATIFEVAAYIDESNKPSVFAVDKETEEKVVRLSEFLRMLKYEPATTNVDSCISQFSAYDRELLLNSLSFMLVDLKTHRKRAYLAQYLSIPAVPEEFCHEEGIVILTRDIENIQEEFKNTHKYLDSIKQSGPNAGAVKREIQQMEEERQQLLAKITKIQKRVQNVPKSDLWLQAGKNLRNEQLKEISLQETLKEQTSQIALVEKKYAAAAANLKSVMDNLSSLNADAVFSKMEEEYRMNKFLATVNLPKAISDAKSKVSDLQDILSREEINEVDIGRIEKEINDTNEINSRLIEEKMKSSNTGDANLALFRQQASIISSKKEGTLAQLNEVIEELSKLQKVWNERQEQGATSKKMLVGDDFKRYVSELRGKSTLFKRKKGEMSSISTEFGILQRTQEILMRKAGDLQGALTAVEKREGIAGFHQAQENLEKVSELKSEKDEEKGKRLQEISELVQELVQSINDKKSLLAPIIQNLRSMRQEHQELEDTLAEKKKIYDSTMYGVESELANINSEVKGSMSDIHAKQGKYHLLNQLIQYIEVAQDRIMNEMKAYIGADEMIELVQKSRGFKSYRELYTKKIAEAENAAKILKMEQKEVKMKHEPNMRQIAMFSNVQQLLALKMEHNKKIISGHGLEDDAGVTLVTQDRLVLS